MNVATTLNLPRLTALATLLLMVLATSACATTQGQSSPFSPAHSTPLDLNDEVTDRMGRSNPVNPRDGSPYRSYELNLDYGDVVRIVVESSEITPGITLYGPDGTLVGSTETTQSPRAGTTHSGYGGYDAYGGLSGFGGHGYGHGYGYDSFGYDPYSSYGATTHHHDSAEGRANLIRQATEAGTYTIIVSSKFSDEFGTYNLRSEYIDRSATLNFPGNITGYLYDGGRLHPTTRAPRNTYPLHLEEDQAIEFDIKSSDFVPHLSVVDARTEEILLTHISGTGADSRLLTELPAGEYELWTSATQAGKDGRYSLSVSEGDIERTEEFFIGERFRSFLGWSRESIPSSMRSGESLTFQIEEPGLLDVAMSSMDFDTYLILTDSAGRVLTEDRESGRFMHSHSHHHYDPYSYQMYGNARIIWPVEPGEYTLWATSFQEHENGAYSLESSLEFLPTERDFTVGGSATGALTQASEHHPRRYTHTEYFTLTVEEAAEVRINVDGASFEPFIMIEDSSGTVVAETQYDYYGGITSAVTHHLSPGTYRVAVTTMGGLQFGTFTVNAREAGPSGG